MKYVKTIAIDGPVASGKSSVGLALADRLGYIFLDTGAVTWAVNNYGLKPNDENAISELVYGLRIMVQKTSDPEKRANDIFINEIDVSESVMDKRVNDHVS